MNLTAIIDDYASEYDLRDVSARGYRSAEKCFSQWLRRPATIDDVRADTLAAWLADMSASMKPSTCGILHRRMLALWRYAKARGLTAHPAPSRSERRSKYTRQPAETPETPTIESLYELTKPKLSDVGNAEMQRRDKAMKMFRQWRGGETRVSLLTPAMLRKFKTWMLDDKGLEPSVAESYLITLSQAIADAHPSGGIPQSRGATRKPNDPEAPRGTVRAFARQYVSNREVSNGYIEQLLWAVTRLEKYNGHMVRLEELTPAMLNGFLRWMKDAGLKDNTRLNVRRLILCLWHAAADASIIPEPRGILRIARPDIPPAAWTFDQVKTLLAACNRMDGLHDLTRIPRRLFWRAFTMAAWDTGLRGCDIRPLQRSQIPQSRRFTIVQAKTKKRKHVQLHESTVAAIDELCKAGIERPLIWPLWGRLELFRREARQLVNLAGLRGGIGRLRHSAGTAMELAHPGRGHEHLGNTRDVFEQHYLDADMLAVDRPLPPALV